MIKRSGFWGQGEQVLPDLPAAAAAGQAGGGSGGVAAPAGSTAAEVAPLGELEFILDRRRQSKQRP